MTDATTYTHSRELQARAEEVIPGGVNSPVRAFRSVGGDPLFIDRARGSRVWDVDDNDYIDYIGSWGPMILGHGHPATLAAITEAIQKGVGFGASTAGEVSFAETIVRLMPSIQRVRLVNSGTEACMSAVRVARGYTKRDRVIKVAGGYHGHADYLLVRAGSGAETLGIPDSAGVPAGAAQDTLVVPYNDLHAMRAVFSEQGERVAAILIEPVAGNMGCVPPQPGYLEGLRKLCDTHKALLIFDEVMTGFRVALGGAQERYGVTPDLTCMGKVIGGGLPLAAYGGRAHIMDQIAPLGPVYQAGTLSGNPLGVAAGITTLEALERTDPYARLEALGLRLADGLRQAGSDAKIPLWVNQVGSMITAFFCEGPVIDLATAQTSDLERFGRYHREMRDRGVFLPPSQFEALFISAAHSEADIDRTIEVAAAIMSGF
ncbi:MAG: glutamate-1-semialdehyde-2,1-aminomutase [Proteobacteria bacterium]|nr:MAG: glutamate-1-semialdehyde-2,1-aminomutase [Pseudomonadota bacterium]PIE17710.1 MAG: glutamate-1-semialdehyde-2,1-aminomutase [Pseudomonadota bacterium]